MNHNLETPARLNNIRPSASTIRKTSLVQWNSAFETPAVDYAKTPHQIANDLRKDIVLDTPPSFVLQSRTNIRNPNESFEIEACEISMLLSEDFPELDQRGSSTPSIRRDSSFNETQSLLSLKRSCYVALDSLDYLVSTSPCKKSLSSSFSTPKMPRVLKSRRVSPVLSDDMSQLQTGSMMMSTESLAGVILEREAKMMDMRKDIIADSGESIDSTLVKVEVRFLTLN